MTNGPQKQRRANRSCCAVIEEVADEARDRRLNRTKRQPWIVLKIMVFLTSAIMAYAAYVYLGRLCTDMIRRTPGAGGSQATGIVLAAFFSIFWLWMVWAYIKVVLTPPGFARDYAPKSDRPLFPEAPPIIVGDMHSQAGSEHELNLFHKPHSPHTSGPSDVSQEDSPVAAKATQVTKPEPSEDTNAGILDALLRPPPVAIVRGRPSPSQPGGRKLTKLSHNNNKKVKQPKVYVARRPPTTPVLHPAHRYCMVDGLVKPYRAHHCRNCGTCILKYDHHCPWIGQCVGARNQKFFLNFCQAASIATLYIFATLLAFTIRKANMTGGDIDPQFIVIVSLSALFAVFTLALQISHVFLVSRSQTTVESLQLRHQRERESDALNRAFGHCGILEKRTMRRVWEEEWGQLDKEGNLWWLGSAKRGWVDVMGRNPLGWFLPVGRSLSDGLDYPPNPRFDEEGRWRRRVDWPKELQ